jgi:hypothetical protein
MVYKLPISQLWREREREREREVHPIKWGHQLEYIYYDLLLHLSIPNLSSVMVFNHSIIFADCTGQKKALKNLKHEESQD